MIWVIGIALVVLAIYFIFLCKPKNNETTYVEETVTPPKPPEASNHEGFDEENNRWVFKGTQSDLDELLPSFKPDQAGNHDEPDKEKDNWERFDFYNAIMIPAKGRYRINYEDGRGLKTERDIQVKRVHENDGQYAIDALCLLRNAHRCFLEHRIQKAVNLDTGEILGDLASDAIAQYTDSHEGRTWAAIDKEWKAISILTFVCRADGQMRKAERVIIADYLKRHCADALLDDAALDSAIKFTYEPDQKEFMRIVSDLKTAGDREYLKDLLDCATRITQTQKTLSPMEKACLEIIAEAAS